MINDNIIVVAGPCSAESLGQLGQIVQELSHIPQVDMIRCGAWKPRSRPDGFQGAGEEALDWIRQIKAVNKFVKFAIEAALPQHVELALEYGVDAVWVGARTVSNPFSVQELASSLEGVSIPVMIKNPIAPDLKMWIGAIERFQRAKVSSLYAIHRGFSTLTKYGLRNEPLWSVPLELKRIMPEMPLLCDPSHLGGNAALVEPIAKEAVLLGFNGIMVETHSNPSEALTDSAQQITPSVLCEIIKQLESLSKVLVENRKEVILKERIEVLENEKDIVLLELDRAKKEYDKYLKGKPKTL